MTYEIIGTEHETLIKLTNCRAGFRLMGHGPISGDLAAGLLAAGWAATSSRISRVIHFTSGGKQWEALIEPSQMAGHFAISYYPVQPVGSHRLTAD